MLRLVFAKCVMVAGLVLSAIMATAFAAQAQGVLVRPMMMEVAGRPGQTLNVPLELRGTAAEGTVTMDLALHELMQSPGGSWLAVDVDADLDAEGHASAADWVSLSAEAPVVQPLETTELTVSIRIPQDARGYHFAALMVRSRADPDAEGLQYRMGFMIPIIVEIQGRPARQNISLPGVSMEFVDTDFTEERPDLVEGREHIGSTFAHLGVVNAGRTYSRVSGELRIEQQAGQNWRLVTRQEISERGIIPGSELRLGGDLERRLPSGTYRLTGRLNVDGRRAGQMQEIIEFEGDPDVDRLALDTELRLTPELVNMDIVPGATRTTAVSIENPSEDPIAVRIGVDTPDGLKGVAMGELRGTELSAAPWTEVRPSEFTLRPNGRQNVRVISRIPREDLEHPNFYTDLILSGQYEDGQSAGETRSRVHLADAGAESPPRGVIERLAVAEGEAESRYLGSMRFVNTGLVHAEPRVRLTLLNPQGNEVRRFSVSASESGPLLPLGTRRFGGELDFSGIGEGVYGLRANVELEGGDDVSTQRVIRVEHEDVQTDDGPAQAARVTVLEGEELPEPEAVEG